MYCSPTKAAIHNPNPRTPPSPLPQISGSCQNSHPNENFPPRAKASITNLQQPLRCSHATTQQRIAAVSRKQSQSIALLILHRNDPLRRRIQLLGWLQRHAEQRLTTSSSVPRGGGRTRVNRGSSVTASRSHQASATSGTTRVTKTTRTTRNNTRVTQSQATEAITEAIMGQSEAK